MGLFDSLFGGGKKDEDSAPEREKVNETGIRAKRFLKFAVIGALVGAAALTGLGIAIGFSALSTNFLGTIAGGWLLGPSIMAHAPTAIAAVAATGAVLGGVLGVTTAGGEIRAEQAALDREASAAQVRARRSSRAAAQAELKQARASERAQARAMFGDMEEGTDLSSPRTPGGGKGGARGGGLFDFG